MNIRKKFMVLALVGLIVGCKSTDKSITLTGKEYDQYIEDQKKLEKLSYLQNAIERDFLYEVDQENIEEGIYKGLFAALDDPYSVYYNDSEFQKLLEDNAGEFGGIGIVITAESEEFITVVSPITGTPGERGGIQPGDKIIAINDTVYFGSDLEEAVETMRGEPGTDVSITIRREAVNAQGFEDIDMTITREIIRVESVASQEIGDYTYISLYSFDENTASDFESIIKEAAQTSQGAVIDLRNNPGGLLSSVVEISDLLLPEGDIVSTVDKAGKKEVQSSDGSMVDIPLVVLINEGSASASEILAGALQDHGRAEIIGTQSFGKGIVQKIYPLSEGGYKLTVSEYYTAKGNKIHDVGVTPDIVLDLDEEASGIGPDFLEEDNQLAEALDVLGR